MNFLKKIFGSEKAAPEGVEQIKQNIQKNVADLKQSLKEINSAEISEDIYKKLYSAAKESREQFTAKLQKELEMVRVCEKNDYEPLKKLHTQLAAVLNNIARGNLKYSYYLGLVFKNQMNAIGKQVQALTDSTNYLGKYLHEIEEKKAPAERKQYLESEILIFEKRKKELEEEQKELFGKKKSKQEEIAELSETLKTARTETADEISGLSEKRKEASARIFSMIDPLNRALKKYEKQAVFEKSTGLALKNYIEDPVKAACNDSTGQLKIILGGLMKLVESNQIALKENARDKITELQKRLNDIPSLANHIREVDERINVLNEKQRGEENAESGLKEEIKTSENELISINRGIEHNEKELKSTGESLDKLRGELENAL